MQLLILFFCSNSFLFANLNIIPLKLNRYCMINCTRTKIHSKLFIPVSCIFTNTDWHFIFSYYRSWNRTLICSLMSPLIFVAEIKLSLNYSQNSQAKYCISGNFRYDLFLNRNLLNSQKLYSVLFSIRKFLNRKK